MKSTITSLFTLLSATLILAQAPSNGLVDIFDGINVPYGTPVGNVTVAEDRNGAQCAIQFDGEPTTLILVQGAAYSFHPDSSLSISLWYQGGSSEAGDLETLFAKHGAGTNPVWNPSYALELYDLNTPLMASPTASAWVDQEYITFPGPDPTWHHVVGVFEPGAWKIYFDNALRGSSEGSESHVAQTSGDISIGENFEGKLDDIYLYDRALSADEVDLLFNASSLCLVGISELEELEVNVFPSPTNGFLQIDLQEVRSDRIEIIDAQGRVLKVSPIYLKRTQLDLMDLDGGRYIIRFSYRGEVIGQKSFMKGC